jgi:hypothetical protein
MRFFAFSTFSAPTWIVFFQASGLGSLASACQRNRATHGFFPWEISHVNRNHGKGTYTYIIIYTRRWGREEKAVLLHKKTRTPHNDVEDKKLLGVDALQRSNAPM